MLGFYADFPKNVHRMETFYASISDKRLQRAFVETLCRLNSETFSLEEIAAPSIPSCRTVFEFGVADGGDFNFLDSEEKEKLLETLNKKPLHIMDFLCIIRYSKMHEQSKTRMRFDYYMMRLAFSEHTAQIRVFHERGLRHISPDDLIRLVVERVNAGFSRRKLRLIEPAWRSSCSGNSERRRRLPLRPRSGVCFHQPAQVRPSQRIGCRLRALSSAFPSFP
jgi:hypothetical protein